MIGIIAAMEMEISGYRKALKETKAKNIAGKEFLTGKLNNKDVVVALCGIGKVNAAATATIMALHFSPKLILNTGVSGSLGKLKTLDVIIADRVCQYDMDTSPLGDPKGFISGVGKIFFECDDNAQKKFLSIIENSFSGTIASGDRFVANSCLAKSIADEFGALSCDMESGAIGHIAHIFNVPFLCIRCISDGGNEEAQMTFLELAEIASEKCVAAVINGLPFF